MEEFLLQILFPPKTDIVIIPLKLGYKKIAGGYNYVRYDEQLYKKVVAGKKFDLILIDSPFGDQKKRFSKFYSRIDILDYLPQCLCDNFAIVIDDYNRKGEQNLVYEVEKSLSDANIEFMKGTYAGETVLCVIASKEWGFLCTL